jgi:hypothetical protein
MRKFIVLLLGIVVASCTTASVKETGEILKVRYQIEVAYTNGDIDTLDVEYFLREGEIADFKGLDLRQNEGVSYIHCDDCKDEYLRHVKSIVADVRRYNVLDYSFFTP